MSQSAKRKPLTEKQRINACARSNKHYIENREKKLEYQKEYAAANKEKIRVYQQKNRERKLKYNKEYQQKNKERLLEYGKEYRQKNKEKIKEYRQNNRERALNYYQDNREQLRKKAKEYTAAHTEENSARAAKWYAENPERGKANARVADHKRRARIAVVGGTFTKEDIRNLYAIQGAKCYYCSVSIEEEYHIDHMTPIIRGGSNDISNLCLTDPDCNRRKHTKTAEEFISNVG